MIVVVVQLSVPKRSRDAAIESARKTAPTYTALASKGLIRKYYINGDAGAGGVYLWQSEAAARAWYTPEWAERMQATHGVKPIVTYYESLVVVDNERGKFAPRDRAIPRGVGVATFAVRASLSDILYQLSCRRKTDAGQGSMVRCHPRRDRRRRTIPG